MALGALAEKLGEAQEKLGRLGVDWAVIGEVGEGPPGLLVHRKDGRTERVGPFVEEELARLVSSRGPVSVPR